MHPSVSLFLIVVFALTLTRPTSAWYYQQYSCEEYMKLYMGLQDHANPQSFTPVYKAMRDTGLHAQMRRCVGFMKGQTDAEQNVLPIDPEYPRFQSWTKLNSETFFEFNDTVSHNCCFISVPEGVHGQFIKNHRLAQTMQLANIAAHSKVYCSHYHKTWNQKDDFRPEIDFKISSLTDPTTLDTVQLAVMKGLTDRPSRPTDTDMLDDYEQIYAPQVRCTRDYPPPSSEDRDNLVYEPADNPLRRGVDSFTVTCTNTPHTRIWNGCTNASDIDEFNFEFKYKSGGGTLGFELNNPGDWLTLIAGVSLLIYAIFDVLKTEKTRRICQI